MKDPHRQLSILVAIALAVLLFDLVTKELATVLLASGASAFSPEPSTFRFVLAHNDGAAGGLWLGDSTRMINILSMSLVVLLAAMVSRQLATTHKLAPVALGLVIGAALGNTVSLVLGPAVVDFIAFNAGSSEIVFNVADIALVAGVALLAPVAFSLVAQIRSATRVRKSRPVAATVLARAADTVRRTAVFEREVPIALASEIAKPPVADGARPSKRTLVVDHLTTPDADLRAP